MSLTASPFIFTQMLHRPATELGLYCLAVMSGVPIGSLASSRLASRVRLTLLLRVTSTTPCLAPPCSLSQRRAACSTSRPCLGR